MYKLKKNLTRCWNSMLRKTKKRLVNLKNKKEADNFMLSIFN